jgi:STE24 endopeptidase
MDIMLSTKITLLHCLAHELGHWSMNHTLKILVVTQLHLLAIFWLFSLFISNTALYQSFGFSTQPILIGFILFQYIYAPVEHFINFFMHVYSRKNEYEAGKSMVDAVMSRVV